MCTPTPYVLPSVGGNLSILYFPGVFGDLLLWEEGALYYSPNSGTMVLSTQ